MVPNVEREYGSYARMAEEFRFTDVYDETDWDAPDRLNVAHEACDRHVDGGGSLAMLHVDRAGNERSISYEELSVESNRFANLLSGLGVERGDRVFTYLPRVPEHFVTLLGTLKAGAVFGAINERYGVDGISYRLEDSGASVVVTSGRNLETVRAALEVVDGVEDVVVVGDAAGVRSDADEVEAGGRRYHGYAEAVEGIDDDFTPVATAAADDCLLYYTSGTTGRPKGVVLTHSWITMAATLARYVEDLTPEDRYWSTADMGWLTGPLHSLGPWFWGYEVFVYEGGFDATRWLDLLGEHGITVLHTVPTVFRSFREVGDAVDERDVALRHATSVGEPLEPATIEWVEEHLGVLIHDTYGQTECGGIVVTNVPGVEVRQGSMGLPMPGADVAVVDAETAEVLAPNETGQIAWRSDSPAFFEEYWERTGLKEESVVDGWYLSGDLAHRDEDGYFWFEGRADDVILSSGYRIGPFEVEKAISEHPAVAESAVVPKPDERRGNIVKAYVRLKRGYDGTAELKAEIQETVRNDLSRHEYPREIEWITEFPKTVTGKIRRAELKAREA